MQEYEDVISLQNGCVCVVQNNGRFGLCSKEETVSFSGMFDYRMVFTGRKGEQYKTR